MAVTIKIIWAATAILSSEQFLKTAAVVPEGHVLKVSPRMSQLKENVFPTFLCGKKFIAWQTAYCLSTEDGIYQDFEWYTAGWELKAMMI